MACNSGRPSRLYSAFPLFITHQPPPLRFSLFLCLSPPCPAGEQGLIWRVHNNSCNSPILTGAPRARPGPRVQCQAHMCLAGSTEFLTFCPDSAVPSLDHIFASNLPLFISRQPASPKPNPHIRLLCPHSSMTACPGSEMGHGRREKRREKPCLKLTFTLMIYEHSSFPSLSVLLARDCNVANTGQQEGSCCGTDNERSMYDVIPAGSFHSAWCTVISAVM